MENEEYGKLIESIAPAKYIEKTKADGNYEGMVKKFAESKAETMKKALAAASFTTAEYDPEKKTVIFMKPERPLVFKKVDGEWKIQN